MYTKSEMAAKREGATFDTDPATTLYTVSCAAFLLGIGRNQMKGFNIPKAKIHGTGKDWIRKCDLQSWLSRIEAAPDSAQWMMLCQYKEEYFQKLVQRVLPNIRRLKGPIEMSADLYGDAWGKFKETGRPMDDSNGPQPGKPKGMSNYTYRFWLDVIADRPLNSFLLESALRDAFRLF